MNEETKSLLEGVGIPLNYVYSCNAQLLLFANRKWIKEILQQGKPPDKFTELEGLTDQEITSILSQRNIPQILQNDWTFLEFCIIPIQNTNVHPFNCELPSSSEHLLFSEALEFVKQCNLTNLYSQANKQYSNHQRQARYRTNQNQYSVSWIEAFTQLIRILYPNIVIIQQTENSIVDEMCDNNSDEVLAFVPVRFSIISDKVLIFFYDFYNNCLSSVIKYSPLFLGHNKTRLNFIVYQIVKILQVFQTLDLNISDVQPKDFILTESLLVQLKPSVLKDALITYTEKEIDKETKDVDIEEDANVSFGDVTQAWVDGSVSNLDYILHLNGLAGRNFGDPNFHPVVPWVTDFLQSTGNFRDLSRSKYRLNKGDDLLDRNYDSAIHHVTDVLSEITFYTYLARRTDKAVLCKHVRPTWVPGQYPRSIQRMQEWSPDEAIPEFYTDPQVFKSIHTDLPDLEVPDWTETPEKFIVWHRNLLESEQVSKHLHSWIDLTFGYKLTGQAAIRNKNVCLDLAENQNELKERGVVQLFTQPHPIKNCAKQNILSFLQPNYTEDDFDVYNDSMDEEQLRDSNNKELNFPFEYNPALEINNLENLAIFQYRCSGRIKEKLLATQKSSNPHTYLVKVRSMQVLGCLICQLYNPKRFRTLDENCSFELRYKTCIDVLTKEGKNIGLGIKKLVTSLLLQDESKPFNLQITDRYPVVSDEGLPLPSATLLLDNLLSSTFPVPYPVILQAISAVESLNHIGKYLNDSEHLEALAEFQVKFIARSLTPILPGLREDLLDLVVPVYSQLLICPSTAVQASWLLLDPICSVMGPKLSRDLFLNIVVANYKNVQSSKHVKLYHRVFVLVLMTRFRLAPFFENFANLIIEAAGGNRMCPESPMSAAAAGNSTSNTSLGQQDCDTSGGSVAVSVDAYNDSDDLDQNRNQDGESESEIFDFENCDSVSLEGGFGGMSGGGLTKQHKYDMNTISNIAQNLNLRHRQMIDVHFPVCHSSQENEDTDARKENSIVQVSIETLLWLAHRLGPVLTAKHISRNLLRMMSLCYLPPEGLQLADNIQFPDQLIRLSSGMTTGDLLSRPLLECLVKIAELYGEHFILIQYMPYCWDLAGLCKRKVSQNLEGGLLGSLAVLHAIIPLLSDSVLMKEVDNITSQILCPVIHASTSSINLFSSGSGIRSSLLHKSLDILYLLGLRIGEEMARTHLTDLVVATFAAFTKVYDKGESSLDSMDSESSGNFRINVTVELGQILTKKLAYTVYVPFYFLLGGQHLDERVPNIDLIKKLCFEYQSELTSAPTRPITLTEIHRAFPVLGSGLSGSGNMIVLNSPTEDDFIVSASGSTGSAAIVSSAAAAAAANSGPTKLIYTGISNTSRHLRGNWLAYWEHEISRKETDGFTLKQIKLQSWSGHTGSVKSFAVLDNENSFLSGSKDRTVRLWSLRNTGEGEHCGTAQWVYNGHRKSVFSVGYMAQRGQAVSCDGTIHLWDPFVEKLINTYDGVRGAPFCVMNPQMYSHTLMAATMEGNVVLIDTRMKSLMDFKGSYGMVGLIRSIAACDTTAAIGHSSGYLSLLDLRTGKIRSGFKAHEGEILNIRSSRGGGCDGGTAGNAASEPYFVSTSLDQTASVYRWEDGKLWTHLRTPAEPLHCVVPYMDQVITASTNHKISVHTIRAKGDMTTGLGVGGSESSGTVVNKLRNDIMRGNLIQMEILPLNRLLLLGTDMGTIHLIC